MLRRGDEVGEREDLLERRLGLEEDEWLLAFWGAEDVEGRDATTALS